MIHRRIRASGVSTVDTYSYAIPAMQEEAALIAGLVFACSSLTAMPHKA